MIDEDGKILKLPIAYRTCDKSGVTYRLFEVKKKKKGKKESDRKHCYSMSIVLIPVDGARPSSPSREKNVDRN